MERGRREGKVKDEISQKAITDEILKLRGCCGELLGWDDYNIPLVYTQVGWCRFYEVVIELMIVIMLSIPLLFIND